MMVIDGDNDGGDGSNDGDANDDGGKDSDDDGDDDSYRILPTYFFTEVRPFKLWQILNVPNIIMIIISLFSTLINRVINTSIS